MRSQRSAASRSRASKRPRRSVRAWGSTSWSRMSGAARFASLGSCSTMSSITPADWRLLEWASTRSAKRDRHAVMKAPSWARAARTSTEAVSMARRPGSTVAMGFNVGMGLLSMPQSSVQAKQGTRVERPQTRSAFKLANEAAALTSMNAAAWVGGAEGRSITVVPSRPNVYPGLGWGSIRCAVSLPKSIRSEGLNQLGKGNRFGRGAGRVGDAHPVPGDVPPTAVLVAHSLVNADQTHADGSMQGLAGGDGESDAGVDVDVPLTAEDREKAVVEPPSHTSAANRAVHVHRYVHRPPVGLPHAVGRGVGITRHAPIDHCHQPGGVGQRGADALCHLVGCRRGRLEAGVAVFDGRTV